jgi:hypothetical protein
MVVKLLNAVVADCAMRTPGRPVEVACGAIFGDHLVAIYHVHRSAPAQVTHTSSQAMTCLYAIGQRSDGIGIWHGPLFGPQDWTGARDTVSLSLSLFLLSRKQRMQQDML